MLSSSVKTSKANGTMLFKGYSYRASLAIVNKNPNHPSSILLDALLVERGQNNFRDEAAYEADNVRSEVFLMSYEQIAHMEAQKWFKYASRCF